MMRIMIIGAGWEQTPLIKKAKELGYWVLATHNSAEADGFQYADASEILDPRDIDKAIKLFHEYNIEAVTSDNDDYALYTVGIICQRFGLSGPNFKAISNSNNKKKQRQSCEKVGIKQPKFYVCNTFEDLLLGIEEVGGYPAIVKPVDNRGNAGVNRVECLDDLKEAFFDAVSHSNSREFIVEKFIEGTLMIVDGYCFIRGQHVSLAVASKIMLGGKRRVALEIVYPADLSKEIIKKAIAVNQKVVETLNYDFGYTHGEYILDNEGEIWLVEATNRGGGVFISTLIVPAITEIDILKNLVENSFGKFSKPFFDIDNPMKNTAVLSFFKFDEGKIKEIRGFEEVKDMVGVLNCGSSVKVGDIIRPVTTDASRHGYVVAVAKNNILLFELIKKIKETVKILYE